MEPVVRSALKLRNDNMENDDLLTILKDRFEGWELVELLQVPIEEVVDAFEDLILEKIEDVYDILGLENGTDAGETD